MTSPLMLSKLLSSSVPMSLPIPLLVISPTSNRLTPMLLVPSMLSLNVSVRTVLVRFVESERARCERCATEERDGVPPSGVGLGRRRRELGVLGLGSRRRGVLLGLVVGRSGICRRQ